MVSREAVCRSREALHSRSSTLHGPGECARRFAFEPGVQGSERPLEAAPGSHIRTVSPVSNDLDSPNRCEGKQQDDAAETHSKLPWAGREVLTSSMYQFFCRD